MNFELEHLKAKTEREKKKEKEGAEVDRKAAHEQTDDVHFAEMPSKGALGATGPLTHFATSSPTATTLPTSHPAISSPTATTHTSSYIV